MRFCNLSDCSVTKHGSRITSASERIPPFDGNTVLVHEFYHFLFLIIRMDLVLNQCWLYIHFGQKIRHFLDVIVRYANRTDFSVFDCSFHCLVSLYIVRSGMMKQHQVHVTYLDFTQ